MLKDGDNKKFGCSGCFGCLGIILLIILLFSACSAIFGNSDDESEDTTPKTEENSKKEEDTSSEEDKTSTSDDDTKNNTSDDTVAKEVEHTPVDDSITKEDEHTPPDDTVYGKLTQPHAGKNPIVIGDFIYILGDHGEISQIEEDFSKFPTDKNLDKNLLNAHARDLMAKDAELVSNISDSEQKYHSNSINKDYYVSLTFNERGNVSSLIVSSFK
ncbi:hypothetical protein U9W50_000236 [Staphylococcus pseudintermedius]|nr:hypothetical protein [Staphylococcus pseudintermedius]